MHIYNNTRNKCDPQQPHSTHLLLTGTLKWHLALKSENGKHLCPWLNKENALLYQITSPLSQSSHAKLLTWYCCLLLDAALRGRHLYRYLGHQPCCKHALTTSTVDLFIPQEDSKLLWPNMVIFSRSVGGSVYVTIFKVHCWSLLNT